jgi:uncharacterized protein
MKPVYFDLTVANLEAAKGFFSQLFGWRFERFPMPYEYYRIEAGPAGEPGIDGGIGAATDTAISGGKPLVNLTIPVPDIDACLARVDALGGRIVEARTEIPGIGRYATCAEPGGLMFGVLEAASAPPLDEKS